MNAAAWASLIFLAAGAALGGQLLVDPTRLADKVEGWGWYIPFLELTKTRIGKIKVRVSGLILLLASVFMMLPFLFARNA